MEADATAKIGTRIILEERDGLYIDIQNENVRTAFSMKKFDDHAGYSKNGFDIVCVAIFALTCKLCLIFASWYKHVKHKKIPCLRHFLNE